MPRNTSDIYSVPAGSVAIQDEIISPTTFNALVDDIEAEQNAPRPISAGGTGASSATGARDGLQLNKVVPTFTRKVNLAGAAALIETGMGADDEIILRLHDVVASSRLMMQVSFDDGATWASGAIGDRYTIVHGLAVGAGFSDAASAIILGTASEPPDGTDGSSVEVRITARSVSSVGFVNGGGPSLGLHQMWFHVHPRATTQPISGIRLHLESGGSFTAGMAFVRRTNV